MKELKKAKKTGRILQKDILILCYYHFMKEKKYLYEWCIENNRQDLLDSLLNAGVSIETLKTTPYASKKIVEDLPRVMEKYGIDCLENIIGGAH